MALGITTEGKKQTLHLPLEWEHNQILAFHFEMLAKELRESNMEIHTISLETPLIADFGKATLVLMGYLKSEVANETTAN